MEKKSHTMRNTFLSTTRKFKLSLFTAFVLATGLHAQQYNQWTFGWHASFNFSAPGPLTPAPLSTSIQDAASWCNPSGNLMFYTDGKSIYNAVTPANSCTNCLNGNPNAGGGTQGVLILPKIGGGADEFYIFTVSDKGSIPPDVNNGLSYYTYNTTTGALSTVTRMGTTAGTSGSFTSEGLTAIPHANGVDFWIIVKPIVTAAAWISSPLPPNQPAGATNTSIYAYQVTPSGVSPDPVISDANYSIDVVTGNNVFNEIKCSPDRQYVSITNRMSSTSGNTNLYRFKAASGKFEFLQTLAMLAGYAPMGSSFSPNSRVLYVCGSYPAQPGPIPGDEVLRQYNLANIHCAPFTPPPFCDFNSPVPFTSSFNTQLQLTPDGRIFRTRYGSVNIDVIGTPNNVGCSNIGYSANTINVGTAGNSCRQGLPNNIDAQAGPVLTSEWPKTTTNTVAFDNGVSVDVDQHGDIYSAGVFDQSTQFETVTVLGGGTKSSYLAKYDNCGGLEWVARATATGTGFVTLHSMDVGNNISRVLITGRYRGPCTFNSGVAPGGGLPCPAPIAISGTGIFIATYNYNGCLVGVTTIPDDMTYIHNSAHINIGQITLTTGVVKDRVYVAVNETALSGDNRVRIYAYDFAFPAAFTNVWIVPLHGSPSSQVIDIHSAGSRVAVTGTYDRDIFWNTLLTPFATTPTGVYEAFVCALNDLGYVTPSLAFAAGFEPTAAGTSSSSGAGVQCVGGGVVITGTYTGATTAVFGTTVPMAGNGSSSCAYAIRLDPNASLNWGRTISSDGIAFGHDVTGTGNDLYFTGTWSNGSIFKIDNTVMPTAVPMKNHIYVVKMSLTGVYTGPTFWQNHSYMGSDVTQLMKPARIATFGNWVYVNGSYMGTGQMEDDIAFNSPLTSTAGTLNSFVWRYRATNGVSFRQGEEEAAIETTLFQVKLFPNPAQTTLTIQLNASVREDSFGEENAVIEIYNAAGQLMMAKTTSAETEQVDVSEWAEGIYFVRVMSGGEVRTERFVRE
ncbi:MAG TPA: T9SS type A sorting domain-containing protein [Bacteroidia bacterium]|nr:T9SS type A sorting domain-containing protein [Bacteroidia bacterium]